MGRPIGASVRLASRARSRAGGISQKEPAIGDGCQFREVTPHNVSRFTGALCAAVHTRLGKRSGRADLSPCPSWDLAGKKSISAHIDGMESGPSEIATLRWLAAVGAIVTALSVGYVAHYDLGFSRQEIRTQAVIGAAIIGLLVTTEYLGKKLRKPK
jgi:hypothetical protein